MRWLAIVLMSLNAAWMTFDGTRALIVGDYVTPATGPHAGQLGPWASVLRLVGFEPRSTPVKLGFVFYGVLTLALAACFAFRVPWGRPALLAAAIAGLWYAPIGTAANLIALVLLMLVGAKG